MKDNKFSEIVTGIIIPIGESYRNYSSNITWNPGWETKTEQAFNAYKQQAYSKLNQGKVLEKLNRRIDRHKRGAAIALAILDCQPFLTFGHQPDGKYKTIEYLPNEILAFKTAMQLVVQFALEDATKRNDLNKIAYLKQGFDYPVASDNRYLLHVYKAFHHAKKERTLDLLLLANLLFVLESYNDQIKQQKIPSN